MIKKIITGTLLVSALTVNALAYDTNKAKEFDKFYSNYTVDFSISVGIEVKAEINDF